MRVVRFYVSLISSLPRTAPCRLLYCDHLRPVFPAGPPPRPSAASVPCRIAPSVRYWASTAITRGQCSLPGLNRDRCRKICQKECQTECEGICKEFMSGRMSVEMPERMSERDVRRYARKNVRKNVTTDARKNVR